MSGEVFRIVNGGTEEEFASGSLLDIDDVDLAHALNGLFDYVRKSPSFLPNVDKPRIEVLREDSDNNQDIWKA